MKIRSLWPALILLFGSISTQAYAGPFGFDYGMTKEQVIKLVGAGAVVKSEPGRLIVNTAPRPYDSFEQYVLSISPKLGLLKIVADGEDVKTSGDGSELRSAFDDLSDPLCTSYGTPTHHHDFVADGSPWTDRQYFMVGLFKLDRVLSSYWYFAHRADHISAIQLKVIATSTDTGYVTLNYEFDGWDKYMEDKKAAKNSVL